MAIAPHLITYSLTDCKVASLTGEVVGTLVDLPGIRSLEITLTTDQNELRGDNRVLSIVDNGNGLEWSAEAGGLSMAAMAVITGKTAVDAGTTPAVVRTMEIKSTDSRPYFYIVGQAFSDDGIADIHVQVMRAKCTDDIAMTFEDGEFLTPTFGGTGVGRVSDASLLRLVQHETAVAVAAPTA